MHRLEDDVAQMQCGSGTGRIRGPEPGGGGSQGPGIPAPSSPCVACPVCRSFWQLLPLKKAPAEARLLGPGALGSCRPSGVSFRQRLSLLHIWLITLILGAC